jgi:hypothetical protein
VDAPDNARCDENHKQREAHSFQENDAQVNPTNPGRRSHPNHHRKQDHSQDVVEYGSAQNDPRDARIEHMQVGEYAGGNTHARGDHGSGNER